MGKRDRKCFFVVSKDKKNATSSLTIFPNTIKNMNDMSLEQLAYEAYSMKLENDHKLSDGMFYFNYVFRISELLEQRAKEDLEPMNFNNDPDLVYLQWLSYFANGKTETTRTLFKAQQDWILPRLLEDLYEFAKVYRSSFTCHVRHVSKTIELPFTVD